MRPIISLGLIIYGIIYVNCSSISYVTLHPILDVYNMVFYSLLLIHLIKCYHATPILNISHVTLLILCIICIMCITNIFPVWINVLLLILYIICYDSYNSLDTRYFHLGMLYLPIMYITDDSAWLYCYIYVNALLLFSAGFEKIFDKQWLSGRATALFFRNYHICKIFIPTCSNNTLNKLVGNIVIMSQLSLVFLLTVPHYIIIFNLFVLCIFAICLFTIVDLSFIGQTLLLNLIMIGYVTTNTALTYTTNISLAVNDVILYIMLAGTCLALFNYQICWKMKIQQWLKRILAIGQQTSVFTERELTGCFAYQIHTGTCKNILPVFDKEGLPSKLSEWSPRIYQTYTYTITEYIYCQLYPHVYNQQHLTRVEEKLKRLIKCATRNYNDNVFTIYVKYVDPTKTKKHYLASPWIPVVTYNQNKLVSIQNNISRYRKNCLPINKYVKKDPTLHVYFDESCGLCQTIKKIIKAIDLLKSCELHNINKKQPHMYNTITSYRDNTVYKGYYTYKEIMSSVVLLYPLYLITLLPGITSLGTYLYDTISRNRKCSIKI